VHESHEIGLTLAQSEVGDQLLGALALLGKTDGSLVRQSLPRELELCEALGKLA
jgi:hypothetical protein